MHRITKHSIWVIIPAYNEQKYITQVLKKVKKFTPNIVVVDDGSQDQTTSIAKKFTPHVLQHELNIGKGAALKTGCEYAFFHLGADAVVFMDSDDQHDPAELPKFYEAFANGSGVVFGVRDFNRQMPLARIVMNRLASALILFIFGSFIPRHSQWIQRFDKSRLPKN